MSFSKKIVWWARELWSTRKKLLIALIIFFIVNQVVTYAGFYVDNVPGAIASSDIILDNYGPYNLGFIFVWLMIIVVYLFFLYPLIFKPKDFYFYVNMISLLTLTRAFFIILTHLKGAPNMIQVTYPAFVANLSFTNDLFFSGHTAFPFLGFLLFKNPVMKCFMLISSLVLASVALLTHMHYSIDVFAAFFITYGIYIIGLKTFNRFGWLPDELKHQ